MIELLLRVGIDDKIFGFFDILICGYCDIIDYIKVEIGNECLKLYL